MLYLKMARPPESKYNKTVSEFKEACDVLSPYIERHTSSVCPSCPKVCCINRHGCYDREDMIFIDAIGLVGDDSSGIEDTAPCRFLRENGCSLPRYRRPFRCTWYFCERLLESMNNDKPREYRSFISALQHLQSLRRRLLSS